MAGAAGTDRSGYPGQADPSSGSTDFNAIAFLVKQMLGAAAFCKMVQVVACTKSDAVDSIGTVDVQPLVNMLDGQGNSSPHGTVYNLPYFRVQGGQTAFINDPVKGDIGLAVIADRDSSVVVRTMAQSNPGSYRRNDLADGMYFGCFLSAAPTQWIRPTVDGDGNPTGFEIQDVNGNKITTDSAGIHINGVLFDKSQNVSAIAKLTSTDITSLGGGAQAVKLADGSNATKVKAT